MPAVGQPSSSSLNSRVDDPLSIDSLNALLNRSSALLEKNPFSLKQVAKLHQESVAKVAAEVAHCNARMMQLETILTRQRLQIVTERSHTQKLLDTLEFQDRQRSRKLDYLKRRVNKMMNSADRDIAKQQYYLKKCSLYELDDTILDLQHAIEHDMETLATPSVSRESITSSQASNHSRATINNRRYSTPAEQVTNEAILSTWAVSRCLTHISGHSSTPIDIKKSARDLLLMIERMATLLSSGSGEQATDRTQHTNAITSASLESLCYRD
ncbi:hypothetical protein PMAYCL1PPCAC_26592, partial [Pristionchus mayeri]